MEPVTDYQTLTGLPAHPTLSSLLDLHLSVFTGQTREEILAELTYQDKRGPLVCTMALIDGRVIGYKIGYERKPGHFYSWLGCVDPGFRGQGIASRLISLQHDGCCQQGYHTVSTQTYNQWREMLILNLKHGFAIVGTKQGTHGLIILLEKRLSADAV